jgi:uncharacterized membrane protein (UPF0127 family)
MRFQLDLFWIDARGEIVRVDRAVGPWRVRRCRQARCVIEVPVPVVPGRAAYDRR